MVRFGYTILYVSDVKKSIVFYEKAFGFARKFISPKNDYGEIMSGETTISFASKELAKTNLKDGFIESTLREKPFAIELGFITHDVEQTIKQAENSGATIIEPPKQKPWGQTVAYVRDIDWFLIELCTAMN